MRRICPRGYTMIKGVCKTISTGGDAVFGHTGDGGGYNWWQDVVEKSEWQQKEWFFGQDGSGDIDTPFFQYGPGHPSMGSCLRDCLMRNSTSYDCFQICGGMARHTGKRGMGPPKIPFRRGGRPRRRRR